MKRLVFGVLDYILCLFFGGHARYHTSSHVDSNGWVAREASTDISVLSFRSMTRSSTRKRSVVEVKHGN